MFHLAGREFAVVFMVPARVLCPYETRYSFSPDGLHILPTLSRNSMSNNLEEPVTMRTVVVFFS